MSVLATAGLLLALAPAESQAMHLAGLARAWGQVKYVHPAMATARIDWDAALVRAIPAVESAASDEDYRRAISGLLAELHDPVTRVIENQTTETMPAVGPTLLDVRLEAVDAKTAVVTIPNDPSVESIPNLQSAICERFTEATRFERVVVDLRNPGRRRTGWGLKNAIVKCSSRLLERDVTLAPARFLTHGFYMMQSVTGGPGGGLGPWGSGLQIVSSGSLRGEGVRTPLLVFIVNGGTADLYPMLMALQAHGLAEVVQEGDVPTAGAMVKTFEVDERLAMIVRHGELLRPDGGAGFQPDAVVPAANRNAAREKALALLKEWQKKAVAPALLSSSVQYAAFVEDGYSETPYPDRAHRLLALFRLYNAIEYFFPYKDLMDRPWRDALVEFIPRMRDARDATDYALAVSEATTRIQDSHVTLASPVLDAYFGTHRPGVRVDLVEGQTVVTEVAPKLMESGLRMGDIVLSVDDEPAAARRERLARYLSASTQGRLENKIDTQFLLGPDSRPAAIEVRGNGGAVRRTTVPRTLEGLAPRARPRAGPIFAVLPSGYGYVDLGRLEASDVESAFKSIGSTPGAVFDMRGYPSGGARAVLSRLARPGARPTVIGGAPRYDGPSGTFSLDEALWTDPPEGSTVQPYTGRIVVLVDGSSQSAAEHICALIRSVATVTFVGSRTSGANGGVTRTILPGGIVVNFTGQSVRHADGSRLQRVGIVPQIEARPSLAGIRSGRDDVLERAIDFLNRGK